MAEFSYTAYGELLTAASHAPHPDPRLGHKGLFLDRLDTGVVDPLSGAEVARHALGAKHTYFMVNRSYDPQLGRFLQRDPNGAGLNLLDLVAYNGRAITSPVPQFEFSHHISDGVNVYAYVDGNPWTNCDPLGLLANIFIPGPSDFITGALESLITEYSANLEWDVDWAIDWEAGDKWHSRMDDDWVSFALLRGVYDAFEIGFGDYTFNPLDMFAARKGKKKSKAPIATPGPHANTLRGPYSHLKDSGTPSPGASFTRAQRDRIMSENAKMNGGQIRSDVTGKPLTNIPHRPNSATIDHIVPKSKGGTNSYGNAQLVESVWNSSKRNRFSGRRKKMKMKVK